MVGMDKKTMTSLIFTLLTTILKQDTAKINDAVRVLKFDL